MSGLPGPPLRRKGEVLIRTSISYPSGVPESRAVVHRAALEVDLGLDKPKRGIVRSEEQVREYAGVFRQTLDTVAARMSGCRCIHLFYAGSVSLAFHLGQQISENIHPPVIAWNYRRE